MSYFMTDFSILFTIYLNHLPVSYKSSTFAAELTKKKVLV